MPRSPEERANGAAAQEKNSGDGSGVSGGGSSGGGGSGGYGGGGSGSGRGGGSIDRGEGEGGKEDFTISNDLLTLTFNGATGRLARVETNAGSHNSGTRGSGSEGTTVDLDIDQGWFFYPTFDRTSAATGEGVKTGDGGRGEGEARLFLTGKDAAAKASRLHGNMPERLSASEGQEGGAYIFRPERGAAVPVGMEGGGEKKGDGGGEGREALSVKDWWVEEGPLVSEVHQVRVGWTCYLAWTGTVNMCCSFLSLVFCGLISRAQFFVVVSAYILSFLLALEIFAAVCVTTARAALSPPPVPPTPL